jgi:hypothetical protein
MHDWLLRMQLGLPPRVEDIEALQKTLPELFTKTTRPQRDHWFSQEIRRWIASADIPRGSLDHTY